MKEVRDDPCSFGNCGVTPLYDLRRGFCRRHYHWHRTRGILGPTPGFDILAVRWRRITATGCWEWRGAVSDNGYGQLVGAYVHRLSWQRHRGPIPDELHIDHLCRNRRCYNPAHLEPVPPGVNSRRGSAAHIIQTGRCLVGHRMDEANTRIYVTKKGRTRRICRACHRNRARAAIA